MAANDGTKAGSAPEGVGVGTGVGESLADGDGGVVGEGDARGEDVGAGLSAAVGVQPAMTSAMAMAAQAWAIRRERVPPLTYVGRGQCSGHAPYKPAKNVLPYAHGICHTLTAKTRVRFESPSAACSGAGVRKPSAP